jgi:hypothetical protein
VSLAGSNRARGCEFPEILALLVETNKRLEKPAPESHLRRIAESVCRYPPGDKRGIGSVERALKNEGNAPTAKALVDAQNATLRPDGELEQKYLKWIEEHEGARKRYMQQTLSKITGGCETFNRVLLNLARADLIEIRENRVYVAR